MRRFVWIWCLGFSLCFMGSAARADLVVIEASVDARTDEDAARLEPLRAELISRGAIGAPEDLARRLETTGSMPARLHPGLRLDFVEAIARSYKLWISGSFGECVAALRPLIDEAHRNPADVVADPRLGASVYKGLVTLALCEHRLGNERLSRDAMIELLRSTDLEVSKSQYGAEAVELFSRARLEAKALASGALTVKSLDESAAVFINERFAGVGKFARAALIPGRYRVFAQVGARQSRVHMVEIGPGENVSLELDAERESRLITSPWIGYSFEDREQRARREQSYAARLGAEISAGSVIVVGLDQSDGRSFAYGVVVDVAGNQELRRGSISMESSDSRRLQRALARFLLGDPPEAGISVGAGLPPAPGTATSSGRAAPRLWSGWKWLAVGGSLGGIGGGTALLVLDGSCTKAAPSGMKCPDLRDYKIGGVIALSSGVALAAIATWLFVRSSDDDRSPLWVAPSADGAMAGVRATW